jgi:hypothetical protein
MFTWLKRRTAASAPQPLRKGVATPVRKPTSAPPRPDASLRHPRFVDTAPLPEVVAEGNTQADWSAWEDSVMAMDSQMQTLMPANRVYVRDTRPSQLDDVDAFASVRGKRDL